MKDQRQFVALRQYINALLYMGATIVSREPLVIRYGGHSLCYACGMLIAEADA